MFVSLFRPFYASLSPAHLLSRPVDGVVFGWYYIHCGSSAYSQLHHQRRLSINWLFLRLDLAKSDYRKLILK